MRLPGSGLRLEDPSWALLQSQISYWGITSAIGNALGTTLVDANLANEPSYAGLMVKILDGAAAGQVRQVAVHAGGTLTVAAAWTNLAGAVVQIAAGTRFVILSALGGGGAAPPSPSIGLWMFGVVDPAQVASTTVLTLTNLAGFPDDIFNNEFWVQVIHNASAPGTAPEREIRRITDYVGATGTFTCDAFTVNVEANDLVAVFHESIMAIEVLGFGTMTASSATVPADGARVEGNDYFNGCLLMPTEGAVRFQPRRIVDYTGAGGIFTIDPNNPFTAATGLVDYIIIGSQADFVPAADAVINRTPADVIGNKTDTNAGNSLVARTVVPAADAVSNALLRDVIGNKTSTPIYTPDNVSDVMRYLKGLMDLSRMGGRPLVNLYEGWQAEAGIDATVWTVTNPATGAAWSRGASGAYLRATSAPNANENARLRSNQRWIFAPTVYGVNTILRRAFLEFELRITALANLDNANFILGLTQGVGDTRGTVNLTGFALVGGGNALQTVTDLAGVETVNTGFGETLTNWNKLMIEVFLNTVRFYLNETLIATHVANLSSLPYYINFYAPTGAGGAATIELGIARGWQEDMAR